MRCLATLKASLYGTPYVLFVGVFTVFLPIYYNVQTAILRKLLNGTVYRYNGYLIDTVGCRSPLYDPYHRSVRSFTKKTTRAYKQCVKADSPVVFENFNIPTLDVRRLREVYGIPTPGNVTCFYSEVSRNESSPTPDLQFRFHTSKSITLDRPLLHEFVFIGCLLNKKKIYSGYHLIPQERSPNDNHNNDVRQHHMSVMFLGVDATSRLNFNRQLVRTGKYVRETLKAFEFLGYNKVGLNSFPNQLPLLSGLSGSEVATMTRNAFYDDVPLLWKLYKKKGHWTMFLEEQPPWGLFVWPNGKGFQRVPTDYYPGPVIQAMTKADINSSSCEGSRLRTEVILDYVSHVVELSKDRAFFTYLWISELPHEDFNALGTLDDALTLFLSRLRNLGTLNNTALVFLSDHGARFGDIRQTEIGAQEDKTPFLFLALPEWFVSKFPNYAMALKSNERRLTTAYDVHATVVSLASLPNLEPRHTPKGLNLFLEVPPTRTCDEAFIPAEFCGCLGDQRRPKSVEVSRSYAFFSLAHINTVAQENFPGQCLEWKLKDIDQVKLLGGNLTRTMTFRLLLTMIPEAHFEVYGSLMMTNGTAWMKTVRLVDRLDNYRNQTMCLPPSAQQKFCRCKIYGGLP